MDLRKILWGDQRLGNELQERSNLAFADDSDSLLLSLVQPSEHWTLTLTGKKKKGWRMRVNLDGVRFRFRELSGPQIKLKLKIIPQPRRPINASSTQLNYLWQRIYLIGYEITVTNYIKKLNITNS